MLERTHVPRGAIANFDNIIITEDGECKHEIIRRWSSYGEQYQNHLMSKFVEFYVGGYTVS